MNSSNQTQFTFTHFTISDKINFICTVTTCSVWNAKKDISLYVSINLLTHYVNFILYKFAQFSWYFFKWLFELTHLFLLFYVSRIAVNCMYKIKICMFMYGWMYLSMFQCIQKLNMNSFLIKTEWIEKNVNM